MKGQSGNEKHFVFRVSNFSSNPFKIGTTLLSEHKKREGR